LEICELEEKRRRSAEPVMKPRIKQCRFLVNIQVKETDSK